LISLSDIDVKVMEMKLIMLDQANL